MSVQVYRRFTRRHRLERDTRSLGAREQVVGRARILIVSQLVVVDVRVCDIAPRKSKALAKYKGFLESGWRVRYGLLGFDAQLDVCRVLVRRREAIDILGDELDAVRVAELCGGDRDTARALARIAPVGIVTELVGRHAFWQRPGQLGHVDVIRLVVDGDIGNSRRCWQAETHDDVVAGRAILVLTVNRVSRGVRDFARHRNGADAHKCLAKGITISID